MAASVVLGPRKILNVPPKVRLRVSRRRRPSWTAILTILPILCSLGCAQSAHQTGRNVFDQAVPKGLRQQIDWSVSYADLKANPEAYVGRTIVLAGEVLSATRKEAGTEIEVLQVPTNGGLFPAADRTASQGRFLAIQPEGPDPLTIEKGSPVTVVGTVEPPQTRTKDDGTLTYPVVHAHKVVSWADGDRRRYYAAGPYYDYPYYGYYGGGYYRPYGWGWGGPFGWWGAPYGGYYGAPYYWGPAIGGGGVGAAPSPPPPAERPGRFRDD